MNPMLQKKLEELNQSGDYECWYLVKQPTAFDSLCYLVSFLKEYKEGQNSDNLQDYIGRKIQQLGVVKPEVNISNNYRALRVAAFFGLITMVSDTGGRMPYERAKITDTFEEINDRCAGEFEKTELYTDIIERQIEKMFLSSPVDEAANSVRKEYRLYPVMLLYKILLELGRSTGKYAITITEYRYFVATTKTFEGFLETLLLIQLLRADQSANSRFEQYREKFDNRLIQALKQLPALAVSKDGIFLKEEFIASVAEKVYVFEENPNIYTTDHYLDFLGSRKSLFELKEFSQAEVGEEMQEEVSLQKDLLPQADREKSRVPGGRNVLLYGVPGSGKSWTIAHEYCKPDSKVERLVFHPDYTYSDFVGQILPAVADDGQVSYEFKPGPFTKIMSEAYQNPQTEYILVIEEINRGNAPAIFGEVFQLLDRKVTVTDLGNDGYPMGTSEYPVSNQDIAREMYGEERKGNQVRIPSNLSIIGTMNTSDQNVFTLDTAFQRRWEMHLVENDFDNAPSAFADAEILDTKVTWRTFCTEINKIIVSGGAGMAVSEDKRLGVYFAHPTDLYYDGKMGNLQSGEYDILRRKEREDALDAAEEQRLSEIREAMKQNRKFSEKVMKYLWDDAFKFNREAVFEIADYPSLEQMIHAFLYAQGTARFEVLKENVRNAFAGSQEADDGGMDGRHGV